MSDTASNMFKQAIDGFDMKSPDGTLPQPLVVEAMHCGAVEDGFWQGANQWLKDNNITSLKGIGRGNRSAVFDAGNGELVRVTIYNSGSQPAQLQSKIHGTGGHDKYGNGQNVFEHTKTDPDFPLRLPPRKTFRQSTDYGDFEISIIPKINKTANDMEIETLSVVAASLGWKLNRESNRSDQIGVFARIAKIPSEWYKRISHRIDKLLGVASGLPMLLDGDIEKDENRLQTKWPEKITRVVQHGTESKTVEWDIAEISKYLPAFPFTEIKDADGNTHYECGSARFNGNGDVENNGNLESDKAAELSTLLKEKINSQAFSKAPTPEFVKEVSGYGGGMWDTIGKILHLPIVEHATNALGVAWLYAKNVINGMTGMETTAKEELLSNLKATIEKDQRLRDFELVNPKHLDFGIVGILLRQKADTPADATINRQEIQEAIDQLQKEVYESTQTLPWIWRKAMGNIRVMATLPHEENAEIKSAELPGLLNNLVKSAKVEEQKANLFQKAANWFLGTQGLENLHNNPDVLIAKEVKAEKSNSNTKQRDRNAAFVSQQTTNAILSQYGHSNS